MSTSTEYHQRFTIPELKNKLSDGSNYPEWAARLRIQLAVYNDLLEIVEGTIPKPEPLPSGTTAPNPSTVENNTGKWQRANNQALAVMVHNCEGTAESAILMERDVHTAWKRLREQYEGKTRTNLTALLNAVIKLQFDDRTASIDEYINEFQTRWSRLASTVSDSTDITTAAGVYAALTRCDSVKAQILLGTLPDFYKVVANNIASQTENPTYQSVTVQLRDLITSKNSSKASKTVTTVSSPTAFTGQTPKSDQTCNYCKKVKGWSGRGHAEADCWSKKRDAAKQHQAHLATEDNDEGQYSEYAFSASTMHSIQSHDWQYDSGCSVHITPHLSLLTNPQPYKTRIHGKSGSGWSTHRGSTTITQNTKKVIFHNVLCVPGTPENLLSGQILISKNVFPILHDGNP